MKYIQYWKKERVQSPSRTKKKRSLMPSFEAFEQVVEILLMMKRKYRIHGNKNIYRTPWISAGDSTIQTFEPWKDDLNPN